MALLKSAVILSLLSGSLAAQAPIMLDVDASEAPRRLLKTTMHFPVKPGPFSLLYPKWIPGEHGPTGPIEDLVGIRVSTGGRAIPWTRDSVNMYEFHVDVPQGVAMLDVAAEFISPPESSGFSSGGSITTQLALLSWNQLLLYPKGAASDQLNYQATLTVPQGWRYGTALPIDSESGNKIVFKQASLTTLIDSPVQASANFRTVDLSPGGAVHHYLHIAADSERATGITDEETQHYRKLVSEATTLFGTSHYRDYHFLYTLSDHVAHFGLEHHESSDDRTDEEALTDPDHFRVDAGLLPHEFVHSWNGKFRRPAGLATGNFSDPMKGDLLWVYEGLTEYLGEILTPRSGLSSNQDFFDSLAMEAAALDKEEGRTWRPLADTAVAAQVLYASRSDYQDLRRTVDYYPEGTLIWLDADVTIRALSKGGKSLDDFCKLWAGESGKAPASAEEIKPYEFEDVVRTLNAVQPYDWEKFLRDRLSSTAARAPLGGIENGGYRLEYTADRSDYQKTSDGVKKQIDLWYSLGLLVRENGEVIDVHLGSPAFQAGLTPTARIIAVNGREFSGSGLRNAVSTGMKSTTPISLIVKEGEFYKTLAIDYHQGEKYPHLVRNSDKPDVLSAIITPVTSSK